jgi:hypothetical protein
LVPQKNHGEAKNHPQNGAANVIHEVFFPEEQGTNCGTKPWAQDRARQRTKDGSEPNGAKSNSFPVLRREVLKLAANTQSKWAQNDKTIQAKGSRADDKRAPV